MVKTGQAWSGLIVTKDITGALSTPSVGPVGALYVNGTVNAASVTISGANPYKWTVTLPALTAGDCIQMYITATIDAVATANIVAQDVGDTNRLSDIDIAATGEVGLNFDNIKAATAPTTLTNITVPAVTTTATATAVTTLNGIANDVITAASIKADAGTEIGTAVWATAARTVTAATNITSTGAAVPITTGGLVSADMTAISTDTVAADNLELAADGTGYNLGGSAIIAASVAGAVGSVGTGGITAASIATNAIDDDALSADAVTAIVAGVLTTAMTEAYAADGAAPTLAQAIYEIMQFHNERTVSSTTITVKKRDGTTTAMTFTYDTDSITRAT